jgi:WD40 repeat protein
MLWDSYSGAELHRLGAYPGRQLGLHGIANNTIHMVSVPVFSPDSNFLAFVSPLSTFTIWDCRSGGRRHLGMRFATSIDQIINPTDLDFSPDGKLLALTQVGGSEIDILKSPGPFYIPEPL